MAFNEDTSFIEYNVEQPTQDFVTNFSTIGGTTDVVLVTVDGVLTDTPESSYTVQQINHTTWRVTPEVPAGSVVRLYRVTNIDEMMHVFTAGAKFIARNMDNNFKQIRHAQQEVRDGFDKLYTDTNEIIRSLEDVTQSAQDAADAAEQAAITANDAAAQVNDKVSQAQLDYIHENGAALPYKDGIAYEENAVVVKDGVLQQWKGGKWVEFLNSFANKDEVKRGIANRYDPSLTYNSGERVVLINGDIVKSTIDGNANDPNVDMTGWVLANDSSQIELKFNSITSSIKKSLSEYVYDIFVDVTWFGAKPDYDFQDKTGTDSTSALQSAIDFISTLGTPRDGGRALIKVPVGSYKVTSLNIPQTSSIGYGITIRGDGQYASSLYFDSAATSPAMSVGIEGLHFEDISIFGYGSSISIPTGRSVGIVAAKATRACDIDIKFSRCHISGWDKFLDINGRGAVFDGCSISLTNTVCNIYVTPDLTFNPSNPLAQGESTSLRHYTFLNNRFDAVGRVLSVSGSGNMLQHINDVQFVGNDFAATSQIIYARDAINTIVGLQVVGNTGISSFATAPVVASSVKGLVCLGNHAFNNYVYEEIPIKNQDCTESLVQCSGDLSDAIVSNNIVRNLRTELVRVLGNGSNINVTGNILPEAWSFGAAENKFLVLIAGTRSKINIYNNSLTSSNVSGTYRQLSGSRPIDGSVIKDNLSDWTWVDSDTTFSSTVYAGATALTTEVSVNRVRYTFDGDFIVGNLYLAANTDVSQPVLMNLPVPAILDMSNFGSSYAGGVTIHRVIGFSAVGASLIGYVNPATQRFEFKKLINLSESGLQWSDGAGNKTIVGSFRYRYK